jgi:tape measure domain-containing protein
MANSRDETIRYNFEATGNEQLDAIGKSLASIANGSSDAAPKAQALLAELDKLGGQSTQIARLVELKAALSELGDKLTSAKDRVGVLDQEFENASVVTQKMYRDYQVAESSVASLTARQNQLTAQVTASSNALRAAGIDVEHLDAAQRNAQQSIAAAGEAAAALASAHGRSSAAAKEEAVSIETLSERYGLFGRVVENVKSLLATFAGLFALEKAKEELQDILATGDKFAKFGVDFANAFGGAKAGEEALARVKELADTTPLSLDQVAAAAIKAKKEGLDPFDGTLESLIDVNARYGGSVDTLSSLIEALGRAYNRGSLTTRELVDLQEQGIPVAKILGDAMGKTGDEVLDLAKKGEIGRESIRLLIDQLGESAAGDASKQMGLLGTLVVKVKDQWEEFLNLIGKSGAYDFVREKLQALNEALKQGLGDGTLQQKAQAISDAIVRIGQAISGTLRFLYDHASAIYEAARAYVVLRTAMLALDLAGAASRFVGLTAAVKETEAAVASAAAEGGVFARLGGAIKAIPTQIKIAFTLAAADYAISKIEYVLELSEKLHQVNLDYDASVKETIALRDQLASRASAIASQLKGYADAEIASADALQKKTRDQGAQYISQLENATRYYTAMRVQADAAADFKGVQAATAKLKDLAVALDEARKHQADVTAALDESSVSAGALAVKFEELKQKGLTSAEAIAGAFDHIELRVPAGVNETIALIQQVSIVSRDGKEAIQSELVGALEKLDQVDLRAFQENVSQRLKDAKGDADALKVALQAGLEAEFLRLGLTAEQAGVKFTAAGQKIISTFSLIANNATVSADQIQLAFAKALSSVQTDAEVDSLKEKLQAAFDAGRISADQFASGMEAAGRKMAAIDVAAAQAGAALDGMGKQGETAAERISSAMQDTRDKLVVQANQMAAAITAALQAGDNASADRLRAQFKGVEAEIAALDEQINKLTPSYELAGDAAKQAAAKMGAGARDTQTALQDNAAAVDKAAQSYDRFKDSGEQGFADLTQGIANTRAQFLSLSDAAAKFYDTALKGNFDLGHSDDGSGFDRVARAMQAALKATNDEIAEERTQLQGVVDSTNQIGTQSVEDFNKLGGSAKYATTQIDNTIASIKAGTYDAGLLGQQDLATLLASLEAAKQRVDALKAASEQAKQQLADMGQQLQNDLDQASNNQDAIEQRRYEKQLADLKAAAQAAGELNSQQYQQDVANANALHQLKLRQIEQQKQATQQAAGGGASSPSPSAGSPAPASGRGAAGVPGGVGGALPQSGAGLHPITINLGPLSARVFAPPGDANILSELLDQLERARQNSI